MFRYECLCVFVCVCVKVSCVCVSECMHICGRMGYIYAEGGREREREREKGKKR